MEEKMPGRMGKAKLEQADGYGGKYHAMLKRRKVRAERRRARMNPECIPGYRKYKGYEA